MRFLPLAVDAELRPRARGTTLRLRLRLHELYGRLAPAARRPAEVTWRRHEDGATAGSGTTALVPLLPGASGTWIAETTVDLTALGAGTWELRLRLAFRDGASRWVTAHALAGPGRLRRRTLLSPHHGVVLIRAYATHSGSLALRVALGVRGVGTVVHGTLRRLIH